jgi:hypothetical protein
MRRVPDNGNEKEMLFVALDRHRDAVLWKIEGLDEAQLRRPIVPSGTSFLALIKHLAVGEYDWFSIAFGRPTEPLPDVSVKEDADWIIEPHESVEDILALHRRARAASDQVIDELTLDTAGVNDSGNPVTLRWALLHQIEEYARHAGHADIMRELIDGQVGYHPI